MLVNHRTLMYIVHHTTPFSVWMCVSVWLRIRKCIEYGNPYYNFRFSCTGTCTPSTESGVGEVPKNAVMCLCIKITAQKVENKIMLSSVKSSSIWYLYALCVNYCKQLFFCINCMMIVVFVANAVFALQIEF